MIQLRLDVGPLHLCARLGADDEDDDERVPMGFAACELAPAEVSALHPLEDRKPNTHR